jgi:hypothetical protein
MESKTTRRVEGRVHPDVLQSVLLDEISGRLEDMNTSFQAILPMVQGFTRLEQRLAKLEEAVREQVPDGVIIPKTVTFSGSTTVDLRTEPWFTFSLFNNKDSGDVYVGVNTSPEQEVPIHEMESYDCPFGKRGSIRTIYLVCEKGKSCTVRLYGVR